MNREIKFRIWDKNMKRWWCEDSQYLQMDGKKIHPAPWSTLSAKLPDDTIVIQQYTGLKDKNGKEIYEGDILFGEKDNTYQVKWGSTGWWLYQESGDPMEMYLYQMPNDGNKYSNFEIIGNVFQNPELLKQ